MTSRARASGGPLAALLLFVAVFTALASAPVRAQDARDGMEDVFGGLGTAEAVGEDAEAEAGEATVVGQVIDAETGAAISGVTVIIVWPKPADGSEPRQEVAVTDIVGNYELRSIPPGAYELSFVKSGYRVSNLTGFEVVADELNRADFPLPPLPAEGSDEVMQLEAFVVDVATVEEMMASLELRMDSDQLLNVMSAEDLSKYAASDVADALKRVAGVNIVEGQFAIIRGLEDRYSSTTFNGAPVPSPDPDRQSIQLDLFPSEVVGRLDVSKTFAPDLPGNSAGGSIDIVTGEYPEGPFELSVAAKGGFNDNAWDHYLEFQSGTPVGSPNDGWSTAEQEFGGAVGGRLALLGRELRYKAVANWGTGYETEAGFRETREPDRFEFSSHAPAGDLAFGELSLTGGHFDVTDSEYTEQLTVFGGLGVDLDDEGTQKIDFSYFWTRKDSEEVELRENGYLPGFDYQKIIDDMLNSDEIDANLFRNRFGDASLDAWIVDQISSRQRPFEQQPTRGAAWYSAFLQTNSFDQRRELTVYQLNGEHDAARLHRALEGLSFSWAANYATTSQTETDLGARPRYEPCNFIGGSLLTCPGGANIINGPADIPTTFPITPAALGPGSYMVSNALFGSDIDIEEKQYFGRIDGKYEKDVLEWLSTELNAGYWYEESKRDVQSGFLDTNGLSVGTKCNGSTLCVGSGTQFVIVGDTLDELGGRIFGSDLLRDSSGALQNVVDAQSEASREIQALSVGGKATFWEQLDVLAGVRVEDIFIESRNDPFTTGITADGAPRIFPSKYLLFDRLDNRSRRESFRAPPYNDQILGIDVPLGPCRDRDGNVIPGVGDCVDLVDRAAIEALLNTEIDERKVLPSIGLTYRPLDWLTLRGAWSRTVARPSFREIAYYVSAEPGTDDLSIGNPQLGLSEVESWDARAELVWGDLGDLFAVSLFYKTIEDPVEQIIVRDPNVFDTSSLATYRTFFNNPSQATLKGIEVETRKNLGFLTFDWLGADVWFLDFLHYLSIGGNFTYIDAEVDRSPFERDRAARFFGTPTGPVPFKLEKSRRLYNQPEWIANADISFDQPDWGTKITLAWFGISDVLDAAGGATQFDISPQLSTLAYTLDRYVDSFYTLDLVMSQELWRGLALKLSAKNLTDSKRAIIYDPEQTAHRIAEREYRVGRDFSLQLSWKFSGPDW